MSLLLLLLTLASTQSCTIVGMTAADSSAILYPADFGGQYWAVRYKAESVYVEPWVVDDDTLWPPHWDVRHWMEIVLVSGHGWNESTYGHYLMLMLPLDNPPDAWPRCDTVDLRRF